MKRVIDWEKFMSRHDIVCDDLPHKWDEGAYLGNGTLGALLYHNEVDNIIIKLGHTGVYDNRPAKGVHVNDKMFQTPRLPIGDFVLKTVGEVKDGNMRLDIYNATATGKIVTTCGEVEYSAYVASEKDVIIFEWKTTEGEKDSSFLWCPEMCESPRQTMMRKKGDMRRYNHDYENSKTAFFSTSNGVNICTQPKYCGGDYSTAWLNTNENGIRKLYISVTTSAENNGSIELAKNNILEAKADETKVREDHINWWHDCFQRSFVSISDSVFESFYWIQIYKMASATRKNGRIIDTIGPWLTTTSWPAAFWNLNVQLTYEPMYPSNQLEIAESLWRTLKAEYQTLINNVDEPYRKDCAGIGSNTTATLESKVAVPGRDKEGYVELGNLTWILHCCYLHYRMTMDKELLEDLIYPLLKRTMQYYMYFLKPDENGILHLMPTSSPEYGIVDEDCNYDLALIRWGCKTLLEICTILGQSDEKMGEWHYILDKLTPYPQNEKEGFHISKNYPMAKSHRHFSHLLMFYPLHLLNPYDEKDAERIITSVEHWHSMPQKLEGYSETGAASMFATLQDGNRALQYLSTLWSRFLRPNTMYKEDGGAVLETPLSAANAMLDMMIQSWNKNIHVFPAMPDKWKDATIDNLCAEGAFRVSAARRDGKLLWVRVKSLAGEPCKIKADFGGAEVKSDRPFIQNGDEFTVDLKAGEEVVLYICAENEIRVDSVEVTDGMSNCYGMNEKMDKIMSRVSYLDKR